MSIGCPECKNGKSCGNFHVYAIKLRPAVLEKEPSFPFEGELGPGSKIFYVGITTHTVECEYKQQVAKRNRYRKNFTCQCFTGEPVLRKLEKPGMYVNKYRSELDPWVFQHLNPVVKVVESPVQDMTNASRQILREKAEEAEASLVGELRSEGHAVHYDQNP